MQYFCRVDNRNIVHEVIVVTDEAVHNELFPESEPLGQAMLAESGFMGTWLQCSLDGNFRGCYPGSGYTYDPIADVFVPPAAPVEP